MTCFTTESRRHGEDNNGFDENGLNSVSVLCAGCNQPFCEDSESI